MKTLTENRIAKIPDFIRKPEYDFSDDGNHFTGYEYKGLPLTQCRSCGDTYLSFRVDYIARKKGFTYNDYSKTTWYKLCDKYNGVPELPEMEEIIEDLETVVAGIADLANKVSHETIDTMPIIQRAGAEIAVIEKFTEMFETEFKFWKCKSEFELRRAYDYYRGVQKYLENLKKWYYEPEKQKNLREMSQRLVNYGYLEIQDDKDSFYIKELTKMVEDQKAA